MHLRAMRHSAIRVVRHLSNWPACVAPPAIAEGLTSAAPLLAALRDPPTASPVPAGILGQRGEPGLLTARGQDNGKPSS